MGRVKGLDTITESQSKLKLLVSTDYRPFSLNEEKETVQIETEFEIRLFSEHCPVHLVLSRPIGISADQRFFTRKNVSLSITWNLCHSEKRPSLLPAPSLAYTSPPPLLTRFSAPLLRGPPAPLPEPPPVAALHERARAHGGGRFTPGQFTLALCHVYQERGAGGVLGGLRGVGPRCRLG